MRAVLTLFRDAYTGLPAATWLLALAAFINRAGAMVLPFLQIYMGQRWGWSVQEAGAVISICGVGAVLGSLFGGTLCDRIGPVNVQILSLGIALVWFQVLGFVGDPYCSAPACSCSASSTTCSAPATSPPRSRAAPRICGPKHWH
ncbi:MAG: MFS transporter [Planctomycetes bacterium]|nr:MFS transporter [Planctomycetota bacterium]